jgi:cysteinyl-tRNA synthetase
VVVLADASVELCGDALGPLVSALDEPSVGAAGPFGLVTGDFRHFYELPEASADQSWPREVDALQNYLLAFRRADLPRIGWLDERFRFYRILDLDLSCAIRTRVGRVVTLGGLPVVRHRHAVWEALAEGDREQRSRQNFGRFLKHWDHHPGLLRPAGAREAHALEALEHGHASVHG